MPVPFGLSIGDFVAVTGLVITICQAFDNHAEVLHEFKDIQSELKAVADVVERLQASVFAGTAVREENVEKVKETLDGCKKALEEFRTLALKYNEPASVRRRIVWALAGKKKIEPFRRKIQHHVAVLGLVQQEIHSQAIQDLQTQVRQGTENLSLQVQQRSQEIKLHVTASLEDPWDRKPIRFEDATGRRYPVPLELCQNFEDFIDFLKFAFKNSPVLALVTQRDIWLFTPSGNNGKLWYLITEKDWADIAQPGVRLGMSLAAPSSWVGEECSGCSPASLVGVERGTEILDDDPLVRFVKPLPSWATYSEDLEFQFLSGNKNSQWQEGGSA